MEFEIGKGSTDLYLVQLFWVRKLGLSDKIVKADFESENVFYIVR